MDGVREERRRRRRRVLVKQLLGNCFAPSLLAICIITCHLPAFALPLSLFLAVAAAVAAAVTDAAADVSHTREKQGKPFHLKAVSL